DLVREVQPDIFTFSHALAQQAAYGEIPGRKRRRIHLRAAETVAALPGRERRAAEIALHFRQAGHLDGAVQYAILAGDSARRLFAHSEAERHFRLAADLSREIENIGLEAAALDSLAETLFTQGRYVDAGGVAEQSSALFRRVD